MIKVEINNKYRIILYPNPNAQDWLVYSSCRLPWLDHLLSDFSFPADGPIFRCFSSGVTANLTSCPPMVALGLHFLFRSLPCHCCLSSVVECLLSTLSEKASCFSNSEYGRNSRLTHAIQLNFGLQTKPNHKRPIRLSSEMC